jgi:hypothetical protein
MPSEGVAEGIDQEFEDDDDSWARVSAFYILPQCVVYAQPVVKRATTIFKIARGSCKKLRL